MLTPTHLWVAFVALCRGQVAGAPAPQNLSHLLEV